jgi:hypothetical protein
MGLVKHEITSREKKNTAKTSKTILFRCRRDLQTEEHRFTSAHVPHKESVEHFLTSLTRRRNPLAFSVGYNRLRQVNLVGTHRRQCDWKVCKSIGMSL